MTIHPYVDCYVTRLDESKDKGHGRTHIPTLGLPASILDSYRTIAVNFIKNKPESWCFTDTDASAALGRIIDGPIVGSEDIEKAECALRAILLHDYIEVLVPCIKGEFENNLISYIRLDKKERNEASFSAFQSVPSRDLLLATEFVHVSNGIITESSNKSSVMQGSEVETIDNHYQSLVGDISELAAAYPMQLGASTYFAGKNINSSMQHGSAGFINEIYSRIYQPWMDVAQSAPPLHIDIKIPPLLTILLSRISYRESIPDILKELREELSCVRNDLNQMNKMLDQETLSQADIYAQTQKINESFDAIVAESLLTNAERNTRRVISIFNFTKPIHQIYSMIVNPTTIDRNKLIELIKSTKTAFATNNRIISRNGPAEKFSNLLQVGSIRKMIYSKFDKHEIELMNQVNKK